MPFYRIVVDGKPRKVEVTRNGEKMFTVRIDDRVRSVGLDSGTTDAAKGFSLGIDGKTYKVFLPTIETDKSLQVKVEEATFQAEVRSLQKEQTLATFESAAPVAVGKRSVVNRRSSVEGAVTAPMTGKIVLVKVKKGDQVRANQVLCVIEAMKMENEITAHRAGALQEVNVSEGSSVSEGEVLFVIG